MVRTVAIILERANVTVRGAERSMFELARALRTHGVQVDLLAACGRTKLRHIHVLCPNGTAERPSLSGFRRALQRHLTTHRYDIVHSVLPFEFVDLYQPQDGTWPESLRRRMATFSCPVARIGQRCIARLRERGDGRLRDERRVCRESQGPAIVALSRYVADQLQRHYGTAAERIVLAPGGVRTGLRTDPKTAQRLRLQIIDELGLSRDDQPALFLFVAHDFRLKGLDPLIRAMARAANPPADCCPCLLVVGDDRSEPYRRLAERIGVERRIVFLGPIKRLHNVLSIVDTAILPSFYDPCNRFTLEALAAGKPVVTTRFNGAVDQFADGRHGLVLDSPDNVPSLAQAIRHFASPAVRRQASQAIAEDHLPERVSVERVARDLLDAYEAIHERKQHS